MTRAVLVLGDDDKLAARIAAECADRQVLIIGAGGAGLNAALAAVGLVGIRCIQDFRTLANSMEPFEPPDVFPIQAPKPKFGSDRPYLKKKKGRS